MTRRSRRLGTQVGGTRRRGEGNRPAGGCLRRGPAGRPTDGCRPPPRPSRTGGRRYWAVRWVVHTRGGGELASRLPLGAGPAGAAGAARGGRPSPKRGGVEGRGDETYHDWGNHENGRSEKVLARDWGGGGRRRRGVGRPGRAAQHYRETASLSRAVSRDRAGREPPV